MCEILERAFLIFIFASVHRQESIVFIISFCLRYLLPNSIYARQTSGSKHSTKLRLA